MTPQATLFLMVLGFIHFLGDFVLQSDWMAKNKAKRFDALVIHVLVYGLTLTLLCPWMFWHCWPQINDSAIAQFLILNTLAHGTTDLITSRLSSLCWEHGQVHWFFVVIGFDQWLHGLVFLGTLAWLAPI